MGKIPGVRNRKAQVKNKQDTIRFKSPGNELMLNKTYLFMHLPTKTKKSFGC